jgi:hypothetical protein
MTWPTFEDSDGPWEKLQEDKAGLRIEWAYSSHWANFRVTHTFPDEGGQGETLLTGYIKWDECCDIKLEYTHFCGPSMLKQFQGLLTYVYRRSRVLLDRDDEWDESPDPWRD